MERSVYTPPDFTLLSLLRPLQGRELEIGTLQRFNLADIADQTIAAGAAGFSTFDVNTFAAASWTVLQVNQVILVEFFSAAIFENDNGGKIQVVYGELFAKGYTEAWPSQYQGGLPFTMPAQIGVDPKLVALAPVPLVYSPAAMGVATTGSPQASFYLRNLDGAASHTYRRELMFRYRVIDNVDGQVKGVISPQRHL